VIAEQVGLLEGAVVNVKPEFDDCKVVPTMAAGEVTEGWKGDQSLWLRPGRGYPA
jgi:hypothetical protein